MTCKTQVVYTESKNEISFECSIHNNFDLYYFAEPTDKLYVLVHDEHFPRNGWKEVIEVTKSNLDTRMACCDYSSNNGVFTLRESTDSVNASLPLTFRNKNPVIYDLIMDKNKIKKILTKYSIFWVQIFIDMSSSAFANNTKTSYFDYDVVTYSTGKRYALQITSISSNINLMVQTCYKDTWKIE